MLSNYLLCERETIIFWDVEQCGLFLLVQGIIWGMEIENLHLPRRLKGRTLTATLILSLDIADADAAAVF